MGLDLKKKTELVGLRLKKLNVDEQTICRVVMVNDGSGSMQGLYRDGTMAELNDRCLAVANRFDDNQSLEQYVFSNDWAKLPDATPETFGTYVKDTLMPAVTYGGTRYSGVCKEILHSLTHEEGSVDIEVYGKEPSLLGKLFGKKTPIITHTVSKDIEIEPGYPMFVIFQTDGDNDNSDERAFMEILSRSQGQKIFWMFVGVGSATFALLRIVGARFPNCDFVQARDIGSLSDEDLYEKLLSVKFCTWLNKTVAQ